MANSKDTDRRVTPQDRSDLDMAITELHQTIVRLNKVIHQVQIQTAAQPAKVEEPKLSLENVIIPKVFH